MLRFTRNHERSGLRGSVPRTTVGAWAIAGAEAGFWLGTAFASVSLAAFVLVNMGNGVPPGYISVNVLDLSQAENAAGFILMASAYAIVVGWVVGTIAGLVIGTVNGLLLTVLARAARYRRAGPRYQRSTAAVLVAASTAGLWVAAVSPWLGSGQGGVRFLVLYLPALAGAVVAVVLSRTLPPVRVRPVAVTEPAAARQA
ncbi:MAG TPA: hypothetical protein VJT16_01665 [Streptosporangiaceae bacterium]|jgi:hypothetical protein|nr:hypothetical protein [Streptosporangiaceae bacterium]